MKNEPVAWMEYIQGEEWEVWFVEPTDLPDGHTYEPLYTHPVNTYQSITNTKIEPTVVSYTHPAELTDEEILDLFDEYYDKADMVGFARAILRKAQEK